ncbi:hypothetical protein WJX84_009824 [Apatococcus fuscideae]|uniref:Two-component response regulator n=1 Tax=Apatococcus fuscideae TaxID=2026836 RepID=A0AAW1T1V6_9CHLO
MAHSDKDGDSFDCPLDASGHQFKVLLVEDDLFTLKCTSKLLQQCGYEVVNATNGKEALALLNSREDIDMVLTDVLMPEVSGLQLMDELRNARWRDIPVVAMSAESKQEVVLEALKGGAQDYLVKPDLEVQHQHFCSAFQAAVNRHHEMLAADGMPLDTTANRQAALAKFRAKRKARSFEKKVRYESRRRLAETRPRVRGQFVKGNAAADQSTTDLHEQEAHGGQVTAADSADLPVAA